MSAVRDFMFWSKKPFGVLMTLQMVLSLLVFILPHLAPFRFEGTDFVVSCALFLFLFSSIMNIFHIYGWNRKTQEIGDVAMFIPCAAIIFFVSMIFGVFFAFATLIYIIAVIESLKHTITLIIITAFILLCSIGVTYVNFKLAILLYRAAPNSQILALARVVIEGTTTEMVIGRPQFSPEAVPPSNPQFSV